MFQLPDSTALNRPLPKKAIYEKFNLKKADRNLLDTDISRMMIVAYISPQTIPSLREGQMVKGIYVVMVAVKNKNINDGDLLLLDKLIPQHIVFALQYEELIRFTVVYHRRVLKAEWQKTEQAALSVQGIDIDAVWQYMIATIGSLELSSTNSFEEQLQRKEHRDMLLKQIEVMEKKMLVEKQSRRKYELHLEIMKLKEQLKE